MTAVRREDFPGVLPVALWVGIWWWALSFGMILPIVSLVLTYVAFCLIWG